MREEEKMMRGVFVGVAVSKDRLDVAFRPSGEKLIVPNDRRGITELAPSWWTPGLGG